MPITYTTGDATNPQAPGVKIIAHVSNCLGGWGRGFVLAISKRWKEPERCYRALEERPLGLVQLVCVEPDIYVANMIAQSGYGKNNQNWHRTDEEDTSIPLQYEALYECLVGVTTYAKSLRASVHMPRIGCGLAGGTWDKVEPIILDACGDVPVFVYDLPNSR